MIKLKVEPYCHTCPAFEVASADIGVSIQGDHLVHIFCKHHEKCAAIRMHLLKESKKKEKSDGKQI